MKALPQSAVESIARIRPQITAQEIRLASMRNSMTDSNPVFKTALQELAALRTELSKAEQSNAAKAGSKRGEYIAKYRDFKYYETLFDLVAKQYEIERLDEARESAVIQVIDPARPPERKSVPKKAQIAVLMTLGMFFAVPLAVFVRHALRTAGANPETAGKFARLWDSLRLRRG